MFIPQIPILNAIYIVIFLRRNRDLWYTLLPQQSLLFHRSFPYSYFKILDSHCVQHYLKQCVAIVKWFILGYTEFQGTMHLHTPFKRASILVLKFFLSCKCMVNQYLLQYFLFTKHLFQNNYLAAVYYSYFAIRL